MNRFLLCALFAVVVVSSATCVSLEDETKGTGPAVGNTGAGGHDCMTCNDFFLAASTCQEPSCPSVDAVCGGAARDALDAFLDCSFCTACSSDCASECADLQADAGASLTDVTAACQTCLIGALSGTCATEYGGCTSN